jgi:hypothetical protein
MPSDPKAVALIVERMKGAHKAAPVDPERGDEEGDADGEQAAPATGEEAAAQEMMDAFHANDTAGLARAMRNFVQMCSAQGYDEDDEE